MTDVYYVTHLLAKNNYGGAETQIGMTLDAINSSGSEYRVKLFDQWSDAITRDCIVHIFNPGSFQTEAFSFAKFAKQRQARVVVSPITFHSSAVVREQRGRTAMILDGLVNDYRQPWRWPVMRNIDPLRHMEGVMHTADLLLPNTEEEMAGLISRYGVKRSDGTIIPNGVERRFAEGDGSLAQECWGTSDYILYVGKIDERKNVLRLIRAFEKSGLDTALVIVGEATDRAYFERCRGAAGKKVRFLPPVDHGDPLLASAYKGARVVVLPSYYETPGLSALEGGLAGSNIVITAVGGTKEYFGDQAWYVNPFAEEDIAQKLVQAHQAARSTTLRDHILANFTWDKIGSMTAQAYGSIKA
jgi:glycosyltransferase involved in cell wall biosynthesis